MDKSWLSPGWANGIGAVFAAIVLAPQAHAWWQTWRVIGNIRLSSIRQMLYLTRFTLNRRLLWLDLVTIVLVVHLRWV